MDDVLTLLIHLGYLTWHEEEGTAHIPNEEVQQASAAGCHHSKIKIGYAE